MIKQMVLAGFLLNSIVQQPMDIKDTLKIKNEEKEIVKVSRHDFELDIPGGTWMDDTKYTQFIDWLDRLTIKEPTNATIDEEGNIVPGERGYRLNRNAFTDQFYTYFWGRGPLEIEIPKQSLYPKVDSELLANIRVQQIGQYVTYFNAGNKSRTINIELAAKAINNHVVFPNETFSFNKVVGNRTLAKGYQRAPIIVKGELAEGIGGGICQVSSTLFNAVDRAGLKIVQRYSHSKRVPYVPPGRDATVSWYGPDFQFKNPYNQPILIRAKKYGGSMIVKVYSSDVVNFDTRNVPNASKQIPKEINTDQQAHPTSP